MPFAQFMELALYDPEFGYYQQSRKRVGYGPDTDFFTASTSGEIFGELIVSAIEQLMSDAQLADYTFIEIGTESDGGILHGVKHPFKESRTLPLGSALDLSGPCIVFSNELFDAQPCRRFVGRAGRWHELGVAVENGGLVEKTLTAPAEDPFLPEVASEGYVLDAPRAAVSLLEQIALQPWHGLFVACDYGKSWDELTTATPRGTTRAYFRHKQSNDLLAQPGQQDLTCHVCWDWLEAALTKQRFRQPTTETQEAFLVHHAGTRIAEIASQEATRLSQRKLAMMQLLHPAHLGQKFQVLHARRDTSGKDS